MANKSVYCEEIEEVVARRVAMGLSQSLIAQALGITKQRLSSWIQRKKVLRAKIAEYRLAEADRRIQSVGDQWWLSKVMPDEFGDNAEKNQSVTLTVQMLIDARSQLEATPGLDDDLVITADSSEMLSISPENEPKRRGRPPKVVNEVVETLLIECKTTAKDDQAENE